MNNILTPAAPPAEEFRDAKAAVARLEELYTQATEFLCRHFVETMASGAPGARVRAFYPQVAFSTSS